MRASKSTLDTLYFSHVSFVGFLFAKHFMIHYFHDTIILCYVLPLEYYTKITAINYLNPPKCTDGDCFRVRLGDKLIIFF